MASIRRTLSPAYHDRPYLNGGTPLPVNSPPPSSSAHKILSGGKYSYLLAFVLGIQRFLAGVFLQKYSRKGHNGWRWPFYRCLAFFLLGFLLGMTPFADVDGDKTLEFSIELKPPAVNVQQEVDGGGIVRPRDFVLDTVNLDAVNLGVEARSFAEDKSNFDPRKELIVVTPTYNRALQAYYLNRLSQVLRLVPPPLLWIVVEMKSASMETAEILRKTGVMYRHLVCSKNLTNIKDRGVLQRNRALEHIEGHKLDGIVYFADDDNIYSLELFERIREISRFGTWPVAMLAQSKAKAIMEGPVCNGSEVIGWHTNEKSKKLRRFHIDMSGFAFNSTILWDPKRWKRPTAYPIRQLDTVKEGFQETTFIEQVVEDESQMEGTPLGCSNIMNWHLHMEARDLAYPHAWLLHKNLDVVLPFH